MTILFSILMLMVFGKMFFWGLKAAWGLTKFVLWLVFLPISLVLMVFSGLLTLALPLLLIIGVIVFAKSLLF